MEQQILLEHMSELSLEACQILEAAQVGSLLSCHNLRPQLVRKIRLFILIGLIISLVVFLIGLIAAFIALCQLLFLSNQHPVDFYGMLQQQEQISSTQDRLIEALIPLTQGLMYTVFMLIVRRMIARGLPASILVYTEALVIVRPAKIEVIHWNEVTSFVKAPTRKEKDRYRLSRSNGKQFFLGESFENHKSLTNLVKQSLLSHETKEITSC